MNAPKDQRGFTLPTVVLVSIMLLIILLSGVQIANSSSNALREQYYDQLAREAAESGLTRAKACKGEDWTELRPQTDCDGTTSDRSEYIYQGDTIRISYIVTRVNTYEKPVSRGIVELLRKTGKKPYKTISYTAAQQDRLMELSMIV